MPRDLPIANERLLINFDEDYVLRDLYYPSVGQENHAGGFPFRFGVWTDSKFAWMGRGNGWRVDRRYETENLVTRVECTNDALGVQLLCSDTVDFHETLYVRKVVVRNLADSEREIRLYFHHDFRISGSDVGDTACWDPENQSLVHYKGYRYFLCNLMVDGKAGITRFATGQKGNGKEGTWRDAEDDGVLGMNPIAQGAVDSVGAASVTVPARGEKVVYYWMCCAKVWQGTWDGAKELNVKVVERGPEEFIRRTRAYWRLWVNKEPTEFFGLSPSIVDLYKRSLLIVKTQIDEGGGILAANDSDITQFARDTYSYVWPRDGALVAQTLDMAGYPDLSRKFFQFCADVVTDAGYLLHKYNPDKSLASSWHPWVSADGQPQIPIQEDETALVVWAMWKHFLRYRDIDVMKPLYGRFVRKAADFMVRYRDETTGLPAPSYDLWEERRGILSFTCSAVYAGLRAAAHFADAFGDDHHGETYRRAAEDIRAGMDKHLWRPELGRFARMITVDKGVVTVDPIIDASLYGLFAFGAYEATDPRVESTMKAVRDRLWVKTEVGGLARYEGDYYHAVSDDKATVPGNPWFICTMWLALHDIAKANTVEELDQAVKILDWVDSRKLPSGVLAEQVHPFTNAPMSVSPLTWSHATVIDVVQSYLEKREAVERCVTCGNPRHRKVASYLDIVHKQEP